MRTAISCISWERDCSVQRRHQKVVEVAPSINLPDELRQRICEAAARLCRSVGYRSAGTVEFLLDVDRGDFFFIEVNPRIQVEHTVTEIVTGIDLVRSQILVADGHQLHEAPLSVSRRRTRSNAAASRCSAASRPRIPIGISSPTTAASRPIDRPADSRSASTAATASADRSSRRTSIRCWSRSRPGAATLEEAAQRADRALREFRIRGVKTNIAFLLNLIGHPTFRSGAATTTFIDDTPELFRIPRAARPRHARCSPTSATSSSTAGPT